MTMRLGDKDFRSEWDVCGKCRIGVKEDKKLLLQSHLQEEFYQIIIEKDKLLI